MAVFEKAKVHRLPSALHHRARQLFFFAFWGPPPPHPHLLPISSFHSAELDICLAISELLKKALKKKKKKKKDEFKASGSLILSHPTLPPLLKLVTFASGLFLQHPHGITGGCCCKEHKAFSAALPLCVASISGDEKGVRATCSALAPLQQWWWWRWVGRKYEKEKKAIRSNPWLQSCQTLFGTQAFIRCIDKYEYLLPERDFEGKRPKLSVHDITASLAVIRDDDVDR